MSYLMGAATKYISVAKTTVRSMQLGYAGLRAKSYSADAMLEYLEETDTGHLSSSNPFTQRN